MKLTISEYKKLHEDIKNHRYRENLDKKYLESYKNLLGTLSDNFYFLTRDTKFKASSRFLHDFNLCTLNLGRDGVVGDFAQQHIERCIGVIHNFIDTGEVSYYYDTFKNPKNSGKRESVKITWNEIKQRYEGFVEL